MNECEGRSRIRPSILRNRDRHLVKQRQPRKIPVWADTLLFAGFGFLVALAIVLVVW